MIKRLKIGILGSRGIPNQYGGFEELAEHLAVHLAQNGHDVSVYCINSHPFKKSSWKGIQRIIIKTPSFLPESVVQVIYDFKSNLNSHKQKFNVLLHLGYTSDAVFYPFWDNKSVHISNMDGMEWMRSKYGRWEKRFLKWSEMAMTKRSKVLIADAIPIKEYLESKYNLPVFYISYGSVIHQNHKKEILANFKLSAFGYDLVIARMESENNFETIIKAKFKSKDTHPLVLVGNKNKYQKKLKLKYECERIIFLPAIYEKEILNSLRVHCRYYLHGHSVGGTNPSLLEAMACSCTILAHKNVYNQAVLQNNAYYFSSVDELSNLLIQTSNDNYQTWKLNNLNKIKHEHQWSAISKAYEKVFYEAIEFK